MLQYAALPLHHPSGMDVHNYNAMCDVVQNVTILSNFSCKYMVTWSHLRPIGLDEGLICCEHCQSWHICDDAATFFLRLCRPQ